MAVLVALLNSPNQKAQRYRRQLAAQSDTNAFRLINGHADGHRGLIVDQLGPYLLAQSEAPLTQAQTRLLEAYRHSHNLLGLYHKVLRRQIRSSDPGLTSPRFLSGEPAPSRFTIKENGVEYELSFDEGYSYGLFLDQRLNREQLLNTKKGSHRTTPSLLNVFAYTCAFSVCAAKAGYQTTSLDLSKKYLLWGKENFARNNLELIDNHHDFIYGDAFQWMRRLRNKGRQFGMIILDPPTFSKSKESGDFRVQRDFPILLTRAMDLLPESGGTILCSSNNAGWSSSAFLRDLEKTVSQNGKCLTDLAFRAAPPDFPPPSDEESYLKTAWLKIT